MSSTWKQKPIDEVRDDISAADWSRVHFTGRIPYDEFISLLQVSRAHVYLTYPFVLSWSLLETMSAGGAILASDTPPVRKVIFDDETGLLTDFLIQMRWLITPTDYWMMPNCGLGWALQRDSWCWTALILKRYACRNNGSGWTHWHKPRCAPSFISCFLCKPDKNDLAILFSTK